MIAISTPFLAGLERVGLRAWSKAFQLLACFWLAAWAGNALAACPLQSPRVRVTDPAGLLGGKATAIDERLRAYQQASGHQLFVMVAPSLDGASTEECAVAVFAQWKLGRKGIDDGVLLLIAAKERKIRIEVGYGLEGTLTDVRSSRIIREVMRPLLATGDYGEGVEQGLGAIIDVLGGTATAEQAHAPSPQPAFPEPGPTPVALAYIFAFVALILTMPIGILGLAIFTAIVAAIANQSFPDGGGFLRATLACAAWCLVRWLLIRTNVRNYHLNGSANDKMTWIWYFCVFGFAAQGPEPIRNQSRSVDSSDDDGAVSFSFSGGGSDNDSGNSSSSSDDGGGGSGGGGASDDY